MGWPISWEDVIAARARLAPYLPVSPLQDGQGDNVTQVVQPFRPAFLVEVVKHPAGDCPDDATNRLAFVGKLVIVPFGQFVEERLVTPVFAEIVEECPNS